MNKKRKIKKLKKTLKNFNKSYNQAAEFQAEAWAIQKRNVICLEIVMRNLDEITDDASLCVKLADYAQNHTGPVDDDYVKTILQQYRRQS